MSISVQNSRNRQAGVGFSDSVYEDVRDAQVQRVGMRFLRLRPVLVAGAMSVLLPLLWFSSVAQIQRVRLTVGVGCMLLFFCWEAVDVKRRGLGANRLFISLLLTILGVLMAVTNSGGLASAALPLLLAPVVVGFAAYGHTRRSMALASVCTAGVIVVMILPDAVVLPILPTPMQSVMHIMILILAMALSFVGVGGLINAHHRAAAITLSTRQAHLETIERRNEDMILMSATLAHEIKNPLTAIKTLVQLNQRKQSDATILRRYSVMEEELARLDVMVRDYLTVSSPLRSEQMASVDLVDMFDGLIVLLEAQWGTGRIELLAPSLDPVLGDAQKLRQACLNLMLNGLQAMDEGVGQLRILLSQDNEATTICIEDEGPGFDDVALANLGTPFFSTRSQGTGLGLSITTLLIEQHGGTILFEQAERGAKVTVILKEIGDESSGS